MATMRPTSGLDTGNSSWSSQVPFSRKKYIDEIPPEKRQKLCTEIDYTIHVNAGYWQKLVGMLGFDETSSKRYRLSFEMHGSPTDNLLRDCKYRMVRIRHLYKILMEIGLVQLAQEVLGDFDTEEELTPQSYNVNGMPSYQSRLANPGEKMSSVADRKPEQATSSKREQWSGLDTYHFHYSDIKQGTNNFSRALELGAGAFGKVYKVTLRNTLFACKVLKIDKENPLTTSIIETHRKHDDLRNELNYLAEYRHPNVISLYGWSLDGPDPCLVYEFMSNGSLQDRLQCSGDSRPLTWEQRVKISCGAARGLQFLHTSKSKPLIHGDIKTANILLDESYTAKLGDFGLAREMPRNASTGSYIRLDNEHTPGTLGYLANEYITTKQLSVKVDTYAFGVVLLELYTGRRAYDRNTETPLLRDYMHEIAYESSEIGEEKARKKLLSLQDPRIAALSVENALKYVCLALKCCHEKRQKRPKMDVTLKQLVEIDDAISSQNKPPTYLPEPYKYRPRMPHSQISRKSPTETDDNSLLPKIPTPSPNMKKADQSIAQAASTPVPHSPSDQFDQLIRHPPSSSDESDSNGRSSVATSNHSYYCYPPVQHSSYPAHLQSVQDSSTQSMVDSMLSSHIHSESIMDSKSDIYAPGPYNSPIHPVPPGPPDNPFRLDLSRLPKTPMYNNAPNLPNRQTSKCTTEEECTAETFTSLDLNGDTKPHYQQPNKFMSREADLFTTSSKATTPQPDSFQFTSASNAQGPYHSEYSTSYPPVSINPCKESIIDQLKSGADSYTQIFKDNQSHRVPTESSTDY